MIAVFPSQGLPDIVPLTSEPASRPIQGGFSQVLTKADEILTQADSAATQFAQGKAGLTQAVLASETADTTFQVLMAVRNRALAAYQEIMNLQV